MEYPYKKLNFEDRQVDEHRYVMEQHLGRRLDRREVVHHIDGDKRNNRIENLVVMSLRQHSQLHNKGFTVRGDGNSHKTGMLNAMSKLTEESMIFICENIRKMSLRRLAMLVGVHHTIIGDFRDGRTYKNRPEHLFIL